MINEFRASLGILAGLVALAVIGLLLDGNRPKAMRVGAGAGLLLGGFHWLAVCVWRRAYSWITGR